MSEKVRGLLGSAGGSAAPAPHAQARVVEREIVEHHHISWNRYLRRVII
jgi:hypothetical protein